MANLRLIVMTSLAMLGFEQLAQAEPEPRIQTSSISAGKIIELRGVPGFITTIEFGSLERIENVAIGDSSLWQVTPNHRANLLFLKPIALQGTTNMTVVTDRFCYNLLLKISGSNKSSPIFHLNLVPPQPLRVTTSPVVTVTEQNISVKNDKYSFSGSRKYVPDQVFDDGEATYFKFNSATELPAIFSKSSSGKDAIVNSSSRSGFIVVDQIARSFTLRMIGETTTISNDAFHDPIPGPLSPQFKKGPKG